MSGYPYYGMLQQYVAERRVGDPLYDRVDKALPSLAPQPMTYADAIALVYRGVAPPPPPAAGPPPPPAARPPTPPAAGYTSPAGTSPTSAAGSTSPATLPSQTTSPSSQANPTPAARSPTPAARPPTPPPFHSQAPSFPPPDPAQKANPSPAPPLPSPDPTPKASPNQVPPPPPRRDPSPQKPKVIYSAELKKKAANLKKQPQQQQQPDVNPPFDFAFDANPPSPQNRPSQSNKDELRKALGKFRPLVQPSPTNDDDGDDNNDVSEDEWEADNEEKKEQDSKIVEKKVQEKLNRLDRETYVRQFFQQRKSKNYKKDQQKQMKHVELKNSDGKNVSKDELIEMLNVRKVAGASKKKTVPQLLKLYFDYLTERGIVDKYKKDKNIDTYIGSAIV